MKHIPFFPFLLAWLSISSFLFFPSQVKAITRTAVTSGEWIVNATWSPIGQPESGDIIIIPTGVLVTIPNNTTIGDINLSLVIAISGGTLEFNNANSNIVLSATSCINWLSGEIVPSNNSSNPCITIGSFVYSHNYMATLNPPTKLGPGGPLSVELVNFYVKATSQGSVNLSWETVSEFLNSHFEVEHSPDGKQFERIGEAPGAGTSNVSHQYFFLHERPVLGHNYYRLKQVDLDGNFNYSPVKSVWFTAENIVSVFPSVTKNSVKISFPEEPEENIRIAIFSQMGDLLAWQEYDVANDLTLELSEFPAGQYVVKILAERRFFNFRLMKIE